MADSVYLETSVISALFDEREDPVCQAQHKQTQAWHDEQSHHYDLFASAIVLRELEAGRYDHQAAACSFAHGLNQLTIDEEVLGVARIYIKGLLMPNANMNDAVHLAVASVNEVDYLLTWNCGHIANPNKIRQIAEANRRLGLMVPIIVTPAMMYWEDEP
jgi:predicted nucleic acid-binding protein